MPPPKRGAKKGMMSVNPPYEVASALGDYRTVPLTQAIRIAAQLIGDAALIVAEKFTPDEWAIVAHAYEDRVIEPEDTQPGPALARHVDRHHSRYRLGEPLAKRDKHAVEKLITRISELDYLEAWAAIIACQFRWQFVTTLKPEDPWWSLAFRKQFLEQMRQK